MINTVKQYLSSLSSKEFIRHVVWSIALCVWTIDCIGLVLAGILPSTTKGLVEFFIAALVAVACILIRLIVARPNMLEYTGHIIRMLLLNLTYFIEAACLSLLLSKGFIINLYFLIGLFKDFSLADKTLAAADTAIGLDWIAYLHWVEDHQIIYKILYYSYYSIEVQLLICTMALFSARKIRAYFFFIFLGAICLAVTGILAAAIPSEGYISYLKLDLSQFPNLNLDPGHIHLENYHRLRSGDFVGAYFAHFAGPITFPSYHVMLATNFIWAFWQVRYLRWPFLILNLLLIVGTPVIGAHYFADCIVGVAIACVVNLCANRFVQYHISRRSLQRHAASAHQK